MRHTIHYCAQQYAQAYGLLGNPPPPPPPHPLVWNTYNIYNSLCLSGRIWLAIDRTCDSLVVEKRKKGGEQSNGWSRHNSGVEGVVGGCRGRVWWEGVVGVRRPTKAHVKHAICFIEHKEGDPLEISGLELHQVYQASLCREKNHHSVLTPHTRSYPTHKVPPITPHPRSHPSLLTQGPTHHPHIRSHPSLLTQGPTHHSSQGPTHHSSHKVPPITPHTRSHPSLLTQGPTHHSSHKVTPITPTQGPTHHSSHKVPPITPHTRSHPSLLTKVTPITPHTRSHPSLLTKVTPITPHTRSHPLTP